MIDIGNCDIGWELFEGLMIDWEVGVVVLCGDVKVVGVV